MLRETEFVILTAHHTGHEGKQRGGQEANDRGDGRVLGLPGISTGKAGQGGQVRIGWVGLFQWPLSHGAGPWLPGT